MHSMTFYDEPNKKKVATSQIVILFSFDTKIGQHLCLHKAQ